VVPSIVKVGIYQSKNCSTQEISDLEKTPIKISSCCWISNGVQSLRNFLENIINANRSKSPTVMAANIVSDLTGRSSLTPISRIELGVLFLAVFVFIGAQFLPRKFLVASAIAVMLGSVIILAPNFVFRDLGFYFFVWILLIRFGVFLVTTPHVRNQSEGPAILGLLGCAVVAFYAIGMYGKIPSEFGGGSQKFVLLQFERDVYPFKSDMGDVQILDENSDGFYLLPMEQDKKRPVAIFVPRKDVRAIIVPAR
jgi:hypothetical protein